MKNIQKHLRNLLYLIYWANNQCPCRYFQLFQIAYKKNLYGLRPYPEIF